MPNKPKIFLANILILIYLSFPVCLFVLFWTNYFISIPVVLLIVYSIFKLSKDNVFCISSLIDKECCIYKLFIVLFLIIIWVFLSGIGKFLWQNPDHCVRNTIFEILMHYEWPVIKTVDFDNKIISLVYYFAFWLPSAFLGKIYNTFFGYVFQYFWAIAGIFIFYYLSSLYLQKFCISTIILFIMFSGLDLLGSIFMGYFNSISLISHIENWSGFQYSSITTQLFWVYNQAIPAWIFTISILHIRNYRYLFFVYSLLFVYAPFPFIGLFPFVAYKYISFFLKKFNQPFEILRYIVSIENMTGLILIIPLTAVFLSSNYATDIFKILSLSGNNLSKYLLFIFFEFGIYYIFVHKSIRFEPCFIISFFILVFCPFFVLGNSIDFCMRTSIPALVVIFLYITKSFIIYSENQNTRRKIIISILVTLGSFTPLFEIFRTIYYTHSRMISNKVICESQVSELDVFHSINFTGDIYKTKIGSIIFRKNNFIHIGKITNNNKDCSRIDDKYVPWGFDGFMKSK